MGFRWEVLGEGLKLVQSVLKGKASREIQVREIMSYPVICVPPELTVEQTMALMTDKHVRHLPVVVAETVVGVISIGDVVRERHRGAGMLYSAADDVHHQRLNEQTGKWLGDLSMPNLGFQGHSPKTDPPPDS